MGAEVAHLNNQSAAPSHPPLHLMLTSLAASCFIIQMHSHQANTVTVQVCTVKCMLPLVSACEASALLI